MRPVTFSTDLVRQFLRRNRIATLPQLKQVLGTAADITIFRKLKALSYHTSYSHRGQFYTLNMACGHLTRFGFRAMAPWCIQRKPL